MSTESHMLRERAAADRDAAAATSLPNEQDKRLKSAGIFDDLAGRMERVDAERANKRS